jgi:hypothetical protein
MYFIEQSSDMCSRSSNVIAEEASVLRSTGAQNIRSTRRVALTTMKLPPIDDE